MSFRETETEREVASGAVREMRRGTRTDGGLHKEGRWKMRKGVEETRIDRDILELRRNKVSCDLGH